MKSAPNSRANLDRALQRFAGDFVKANELRGLMANAIVAQMIGQGVVKGGSGLRFRFGERNTRVTMDLDTAWRTDLDSFTKDLKTRLADGWNGFTGEIKILPQANPRGIPFEYVMQPCEVKLRYLGNPWFTVKLEVGHNEIGDADASDMVEMPESLAGLCDFLSLPRLSPIPAMRLEYQVAQKLHGVSAPGSKRAHDLIDLQLIFANGSVDIPLAANLCRTLFKYRRVHDWPARIAKGDDWEGIYNRQKGTLPVLQSVDEAVDWANELIDKIAKV